MTPHKAYFRTTWLCLILGSCAQFDRAPDIHVDLPSSFEAAFKDESETRASADSWNGCKDEQLDVIIKDISAQNLSIEQARYRVIAARSSASSADYLPSLKLDSDIQYSRRLQGQPLTGGSGLPVASAEDATGYYNARLDASWELPLFGQINAAQQADQSQRVFAEADLDVVRASVFAEAVVAYSELRYAQAAIEATTLKRDAYIKLVDLQQALFNAGLTSEVESNRAHQALLAASTDLTNLKADSQKALSQLSSLLGETSPRPEWRKVAAIPTCTIEGLADTPADVVRNRPDIRRAEARVQLAAAERDIATADLYPSLRLSGTISQLGNLVGNALPGSGMQLTGVPTLSIPLFDFGARTSRANREMSEMNEAAAAYRDAIVNAIRETEQALADYHAAMTRLKNRDEIALLARREFAIAQAKAQQGLTSQLELQEAIIMNADALLQLADARAQTLSRFSSLSKAVGGMVGNQSQMQQGMENE
jgi:NodT family efflux transporter outer membrane factor (OMF) lipoprotein